MRHNQSGFTLIEIAIVLVIIGLLLGGVLKGQELITSARVRNLISQQDGIKAAYFGFLDRYRALPGDYASATTNINGATVNGNGNGQIEDPGSGTEEHILVWEHLSKSGFINGSYTYSAMAPFDNVIPKNAYGSFLQLVHDGVYGTGSSSPARPNLKTGNQVPVEMIAEVDRKIDDGDALKGNFQFSIFTNGGTPPSAPAGTGGSGTTCAGTDGIWNVKQGNANCGAASIF